MIKVKDFVETKLVNFENFMNEQIEDVIKSGHELNKEKIELLKKDFKEFRSDTTNFIQYMSVFNEKNVDDAVGIFLIKYDIDIEKVKPFIDYNKLKRYIEMFIEVINKN